MCTLTNVFVHKHSVTLFGPAIGHRSSTIVMDSSDTGVYAVYAEPLDQWIQIGVASGHVIQLSFHPEEPPDVNGDHAFLTHLLESITAGSPVDVTTLPIALTVSTTDRQVYETLRDVPAGSSISVEFLATQLTFDTDDSIDLIEEALQRNPIPLLIPDHRVTEPIGSTPQSVRARLRSIEGIV